MFVAYWLVEFKYKDLIAGRLTGNEIVLLFTLVVGLWYTLETRGLLRQQKKEEVFKFRPYLHTSNFKVSFDEAKQILALQVSVRNAGGTPAKHVAFTAGLGSENQMIWKIIFDDNQDDYIVQEHSKTTEIPIPKRYVEKWFDLMDQGDGETEFTFRWHYSDYSDNKYTYSHSYVIDRRGNSYNLRHVREGDVDLDVLWPTDWLDDQPIEQHISARGPSFIEMPPTFPITEKYKLLVASLTDHAPASLESSLSTPTPIAPST